MYTIESLREKLEEIKTEYTKKLDEKSVYLDMTCYFVDKDGAYVDEYETGCISFYCDAEFHVDDCEEILPTSGLAIDLTTDNQIAEDSADEIEKFLAEFTEIAEKILSAEDPVQFVKDEIIRFNEELEQMLKKTNKFTNSILLLAASLAVVLAAWVIYIFAKG